MRTNHGGLGLLEELEQTAALGCALLLLLGPLVVGRLQKQCEMRRCAQNRMATASAQEPLQLDTASLNECLLKAGTEAVCDVVLERITNGEVNNGHYQEEAYEKAHTAGCGIGR